MLTLMFLCIKTKDQEGYERKGEGERARKERVVNNGV